MKDFALCVALAGFVVVEVIFCERLQSKNTVTLRPGWHELTLKGWKVTVLFNGDEKLECGIVDDIPQSCSHGDVEMRWEKFDAHSVLNPGQQVHVGVLSPAK